MSVCGLLCIVFCVCKEVGRWGLGSLMMRIKGLLNCWMGGVGGGGVGGFMRQNKPQRYACRMHTQAWWNSHVITHVGRPAHTYTNCGFLLLSGAVVGGFPQTALLQVKADKTKQERYTVGREREVTRAREKTSH